MLLEPGSQRDESVDDVQSSQSSSAALIESARRMLHMGDEELRIAHWACGGNASRAELIAFVEGRAPLPAKEYDSLAAAINDRLIEKNHAPSIPYSDDPG